MDYQKQKETETQNFEKYVNFKNSEKIGETLSGNK